MKLGVPNDQHPVVQIDIREAETQRFRHAETGAIQQAEEGDERPRAERAHGRQAGRFPEQRLDLGRACKCAVERSR